MADESRNPADNYEFRRLRSELQAVVNELKAEAQLAREQASARQREVGRQAREETAARRTRTAGRVERAASEPLPREEAAALRSSANDAERLARARERGLRAAQETTRAVERERLALPPGRQPLLLGPGPGGAVGAPAAPYARPIPGTGGPVPPGGGGGGGRIPPVLPPGPGGPGGFDENARRRAADATRDATTAEARYAGSLRDTIRAGGAYDDSLRRHGALTTEFFSALARGEVTLSELRFQLGATIAKFAGWTAAATATFAVIGAIGQLGRGAIDASNGVTQLQRYIDGVDTAKAQDQFIELSRHFNLPIKDVADAMAQMGQVFKNQDEAFRAAEAALYGVRTGNLEVADSVKFLNAIARSGGVQTADELVRIYDRINEAQNQLGVGIRDNLAGVAKATGQWKAAGGSIEFLQTLITTGAARTGRSGEEMGTALQRSAEIIKRGTSKNAEELKKFGIDADKPVDQIYRRAIELVRTGKVKGADITRLGKALSTPQLAPRIAATFADPAYTKRVEEILRKSRHSAENELATLKRSASEQIKQIGVNLQDLGAEFVKAGGGHPFKEILASLNLALRVSTDLLQVFDGLPEPLKQAAIYGLELAALMKIGGKLGFRLPGRGSPEERANLTREVDFHRDQVRRANENLAQAQYSRDYHQERALAGDEGAADRLKAAQTSVAEAEMRLKFATDRLTEATAYREAMLRGTTPGARGPGVPGGPVPPGGYPGGRATPPFGAPGANARTAPLGVNLMPAAARAEAEAGRFSRVMGRVSGFTAGVFNSMSGLGGLAVRGYNKLGGIRAGLRNFFSSLRGLLSDPISMGFVAFTVATMLKDHFDKKGAHYDTVGAGPRSAAERDKILNYRGDDEHDILAQRTEQDILGRQAAERRAGKPVTSLFTSEIRHQAGETMDALKAHKITRTEAYKQLDVLFTELKSSRSSPALVALARGDIKKLQQSLGATKQQSLADVLRGLDTKDFVAQMQADATVVQDYARRPQRLKEINTGYRVALEAVKKNPTVENVKRFKAANDAVDAVISDSQQRLNDALATAGTLREREAAYDANARRLARLPRSRSRRRAQAQNEQARFQDELQTFDAYTDYRASTIRDSTARDRYVLSRMNTRIARLRKAVAAGKAKETDLWQAEAQRNAQLDQIQQDQEDAYQSGLELATARYALSVGGAAGPMARRAVSDAQKLVAHIRGRKHTQKELNDALKGLAQAQLAVQQYIREQRAAMIQADQAYAAAGIDSSNPVAVARLEERFARRDRRRNRAQDPAGQRQQDARVRQAHADTARARQQDRFDTIEFEASIGKITRAQEITQLQTLLKTIHNNRALRRQIRQQIYQLRHAQDDSSLFDLNVGNIKLPTVYEIRRAMKGGAGPTRQQVQVQQTNRLNVTVSSKADVDEVFAAIDGYTGAGLQAAGRAAGVV